MKPKLTPELAYLIGLWIAKGTKEGIGVKGKAVIPVFIQLSLSLGLTKPGKIQYGENFVFFYHSRWRKFFQKIGEERIERFKYLNEYSANYLAGLFDASGGIDEKGRVYILGRKEEEMILHRLGFRPRKVGKKIIVGNPVAFLKFIRDFLKINSQIVEKYLRVA